VGVVLTDAFNRLSNPRPRPRIRTDENEYGDEYEYEDGLTSLSRRFVSEFLLPLVKGGPLHIGRPLGPRAVDRLIGGILGSTEGSEVAVELLPAAERQALTELARYRRQRIAELMPAAEAPALDAVTLRLGAALHNLLALGHPEIAGRGVESRQDRIATAAATLAAAGAPRSAR